MLFLQEGERFLLGVACLPDFGLTRCCRGEAKVVPGLDPIKRSPPEIWLEKPCPVILRDEGGAILSSYKLGMVGLGRLVDHTSQIVQAPDQCFPKLLFQGPKTPVGCELGVANQQKRYLDVPIEAIHHTPGQVLHYETVKK